MAGGKETPRQKMIGMMYLVLTALLALNVSKDILKGFITVNESLERTNKNLSENQNRNMNDFEQLAKKDAIAKLYLNETKKVNDLTNEVYQYIEEMKKNVLFETENLENKSEADTLKLRYALKQDDYDKPTYILLGDDELNLKTGPLTAVELRKKLTTTHDKLIAILENIQKNKTTEMHKRDYENLLSKIQMLKPVDPLEKEDNVKQTWELQNFYHLPMAAVITNLTKIQSDVKSLQTSLVSELKSASTKAKVIIDKLSSRVVSESKYVQAGQPFKADIFLTATSNEFNQDNMQVLIGGSYDFEQKKAITEGTPISVAGGMGKFEALNQSIGTHQINGAIKFKNSKEQFEYYPFNYDYTVTAPAVSVSSEKMNVFYSGLDNPVAISAAGVPQDNLVVKIDGAGASITKVSSGKYNVKCSGTGQCKITVFEKMKDGSLRVQGSPINYRVKSIPYPVAKVNGKFAFSTLEMKLLEVKSLNAIFAEAPSFDFGANFKVSSFKVVVTIGGDVKEEACKGTHSVKRLNYCFKKLSPTSGFLLKIL